MQKSFLLFSCLFLTGSFLSVPDSSAQIGGIAGSFARVGFSSRGMALGNAGSAVTLDGELQPYYNPAVIGFAAFNTASATYAYLPLDRTLNFVSFTGNIGPTAGLGLSLINSGVGNIDARDIDGNQTGILSTSENLFMLSFANRFSDELSIGISLRGYLSSLYEDVRSAFSLGFDFGAAYRQPLDSVSSVSFALVIADVGSRYRWDTVPVYGQQGSTTTDPMPLAVRLGSSYRHEGLFGFNLVMLTAELELLSAQFDNEQMVFFIENGIAKPTMETVKSTKSQTHLKLGVLVQPVRVLKLRFGLDRLGLQGIGLTESLRPAAGFSIEYPVQSFLALIDYTIVFEPNAPLGMSVISLGVRF